MFLTFMLLALSISFVYAEDSTDTSVSSEEISDEIQDASSQDAVSEEEDSDLSDITEEEVRDELGTGGSVNEFDRFVDGIFKDDEGYSRERAAEIRTLLSEGKYEEAKALLAEYEQSAEKFEKEVKPEDKDEAERRSKVIRKAYGDIINDIPPEYRDDFNKIRVAEKKIGTAAEIAGKIKELCETLSKLDPDQYSRTCKSDDDSPDWQKKLDRKLTEEQKKEVKAFIGIMTQCMKDATNCKCQDISVEAFADKCTEVAPLYAQCQKGDEAKCEEADKLSEGIEDVLPDYLQEALADIEDDFEGAQYDNHAPKICRERKVTSRIECMKLVISEGSEDDDGPPPECRKVLLDAIDKGITSERELREKCEGEMYKIKAPQECIDAGITNFKDCGRHEFESSAPQECIDAGLTGESPSDGRKCQKIMDELGRDREGPDGEGRGQRGGFNFDCRQIQDSDERLKCFDGAVSSFREGPDGEGRGFDEKRFRETKEKERECANSCQEKNVAWDFTGGQCTCREGERREYRDDFRQPRGPEGFRDTSKSTGNGCLDEARTKGLSYDEARNKCFGESKEEYNRPPGPGDKDYVDRTAKYDCSKLNCGPSPNYCDPWGGCQKGEGGFNPDGSSCPEGQQWSGSGCVPFNTQQNQQPPQEQQQQQPPQQSPPADSSQQSTSGTTSGDSSSTSSGSSSGTTSGTSGGESAPVTGSFILGNVIYDSDPSPNSFLKYFFGR